MVEPEIALIPADDDGLTHAIAEARAQVAAGQMIPLRDVTDWLDSWGTADERPAPSCKQSSLRPPLPI
ncbi:hypothetical protein TSH64_22530 [Azospirillum sp. TSH64]|nr:hypothetical protein TSH64_22530 [Azospirillum sp. TSH64]